MNILITGATSGIGMTLAIKYANLGHKVFGLGRNHAQLDILGTHDIHAISTDITDIASIISAQKEIMEEVSHLDLIILSAGTCEYIDVNNFKSQVFKDVMDINFFGITNCLEIFLPILKKATNSHLVVISS